MKKKSADSAADEKEVVKPSRPLSAYIYFGNEVGPEIRKNKDLKQPDVMRAIGERWGILSAKEKEPYNKLHEKD